MTNDVEKLEKPSFEDGPPDAVRSSDEQERISFQNLKSKQKLISSMLELYQSQLLVGSVLRIFQMEA
jgi:hypothetical protein